MNKLAVLLAGALALALSGTAQTRSAKASQPDVYLITIDTLRADHVHCYGDDKAQTPALDALAKDGIRFSQTFTPSPITNTSHTSIMTGLLPSAHGVTDFGIPLAASHTTLAELLKQNGYHTAAFIGAVILDSKTLAPGLDRGFDFYDNFPEHSSGASRWGRVERRGMDVVQHAEAWLTAHRTGPHFVWVHLYDPHDPYEPPPPYSETFKDRLYDGEIAYADAALASFVSFLKRNGWYENAIVIAVGDHGEGLGEHGEETHGIFLYDSTMHVPLIAKLPGPRGSTVDAQVRTTDILPTILEALHIPRPARLDGESLEPFLKAKPPDTRVAFGETDYPLRFGWAPLRSVRDAGFKLIEAPRAEMYDLHNDPHELNNKYAPWDAHVQKLRTTLAAWRASLPASMASSAAVPEETLAELRALGYLGRADEGSATNAAVPTLLPDPKDKIEEQNLLHRAMLAADDNRPGDARQALEKTLRLDPKSPTALRQLGELELQTSNYSKASDYLRRALEVRPNDATAAYELGQAMEKTGNLTGSRDALETSLKLMPGQAPARVLLGKVYLGLKAPQAAEDQFEAALLLDPHSVSAKIGLARTLLAEQKPAEAISQIEPLAATQPRNPEIFLVLAEAYRAAGKIPEAERASAKARDLKK